MVPPSPEWDALIAAHEEALVTQIRRCDLPLVGLAEPAPAPAMIGETAGSDDRLETIGLAYGDVDPRRSHGPLVQVHTTRADASSGPLTLRYLLEAELDRADDDAPVDDSTQGELAVDGELRAATVQRAGPRFWAARCAHAGCVVTVVARDWELASTRLVPVTDVEPLIRARRATLAALRARGPEPEPAPADVENPHRALVDAVLHDGRYIRDRAREGLPPRQRELRVTAGLWRAATEAQVRMTDQPRHEANAAVTSMVNQLSQLQEDAGWFAARERLRGGAITETLLYWTGLREAVPSRTAQERWKLLWDRRQRLASGVRPARPELASDHHEWLEAWNSWAHERGREARDGTGTED